MEFTQNLGWSPPGLRDLRQGIIISSAFFGRRQTANPRTNSAVIPVAHKIAPNHELQLLDSVVLAFYDAAVKQFPLHSCPHTFAPGIIMTSAAGAVHALFQTGELHLLSEQFACVLAPRSE